MVVGKALHYPFPLSKRVLAEENMPFYSYQTAVKEFRF
ncbi:hypothetical protein HMPREF1505_0266 [Prevotella sp. ICM33]|nr:hypothetical protein HMPREF1505_0266 [Prevotella sp. ICM33]